MFMIVPMTKVSARLEPKDSDAMEVYLKVPTDKLDVLVSILLQNGLRWLSVENLDTNVFTSEVFGEN